MKKCMLIILVLSILLSLTGCKSAKSLFKDPDNGPLTMMPLESPTAEDGVMIRLVDLIWHEEVYRTTLEVEWINSTPYEANYGSSYVIERLEGDEWVSCAMRDDLAFTAIAYILQAGQTRSEIYELTHFYDVSSPGTYRFRSHCYVYESPDSSVEQEVIAEFTVETDTTSVEADYSGSPVQYCAQYVRTDGSPEKVVFPCVRIIRSMEDLRDYYDTWKDSFHLERRETVYADSTIGFLDVCDQYDDAFFSENYLLFVLLEEGSGSIRHEVRSVEQTADGKLSISIDRKVPEVGTDDMAQWHIIFEFSHEYLIESSLDTLLFIEGTPAYMDDQVVAPSITPQFTEPPKGTLYTPDGAFSLQTGGYHWSYAVSEDLRSDSIADQASRPPAPEHFTPVILNSSYAEQVYAPIGDGTASAPTDDMGYLLKLGWEVDPHTITYTCWPDTVWNNSNPKEEAVVSQGGPTFYAKTGSYIYEIVATWNDNGTGYSGTANYYVYITDSTD